ncbi:unnamed protein product, partial [Brenthis ino]
MQENVFYEIPDDEDLTDDVEATYTKNYEKAISEYNDILFAFEKLCVASALPATVHPSTSATPANVLPKIALPLVSAQEEVLSRAHQDVRATRARRLIP